VVMVTIVVIPMRMFIRVPMFMASVVVLFHLRILRHLGECLGGVEARDRNASPEGASCSFCSAAQPISKPPGVQDTVQIRGGGAFGCRSQAELAQGRVVIGAAPQRPVITALAFRNR
jgi:hypothetical protein